MNPDRKVTKTLPKLLNTTRHYETNTTTGTNNNNNNTATSNSIS